MRIVLDTNIFLSALISPGGPPASIVAAWLARRFVLISHPIQLDELRGVTRRDKLRSLIQPAEVGRRVNQIKRLAEFPSTLPSVRRSPDPDDDFLLALCEAAQADRLVTGDKADLLALERHGTARIMTMAGLVHELG